MWKRWWVLAVIGSMAAGLLSGCGREEEQAKDSPAAAGQGQTAGAASGGVVEPIVDEESMFTDRDRSGDYDPEECVRIELGGGDVEITEEGVYLLSGSMENGMILVDAHESAKVQLVLDNVEVSNSRGAAIYVRQADKVFITLAEGSVNALSGGDSYVSIDDGNIDGIIFAKSDLTINGKGSLNVAAVTGHGIVSKDDLKVAGGTVAVTAPGHGLSGRDSVRICEGASAASLRITAGKDGIHSENADRADKGFVYIEGGSVTVVSAGDSISAGSSLQIDGGTFDLTAGQGSGGKTVARDEEGNDISAKGIKAGGEMLVNGGSFLIDSQDDALHSDSSLAVTGGQFDISSGDDGVHADESVTVSGGTVNISACYEGIEGNRIDISGGRIRLRATDDGLNVAGDGSPALLISGGEIYINADGDGIDSNGTLTVTGGETYISGPETGANGALDYESGAQITGGTLVALGNSGMAMNFGEGSTQGSALITVDYCKAGTEVSLKDEKGNVLAAYTGESGFNSVMVSCAEMVQGGTYTVCVGSSEYEVKLDSLIYGTGFEGLGGFGGGRPGMRGMPGDGERPEMPGDGERPEMPGSTDQRNAD